MDSWILMFPAGALAIAGVAAALGAARDRRARQRKQALHAKEAAPSFPPCVARCLTCPSRDDERRAIEESQRPGRTVKLAALEAIRIAARTRHHWMPASDRDGYACVHCTVHVAELPAGESADRSYDRESSDGRHASVFDLRQPEPRSAARRP